MTDCDEIEAAFDRAASRYDKMRRLFGDRFSHADFAKLFLQQWPAPPQCVADAHRLFGDERATELIRQAEHQARHGFYSFEDTLDMLTRREVVARELDKQQTKYRDLPFAISLKGWP